MKPYWALFRTRMRLLLQYRTAALAGIATQWLFGFVMVSVLIAFYHFSASAQPMTLQQTVTYTWVGQAMLGMQPWNVDRELFDSVRSGAVAYDLTRPIDMYSFWFARTMAMRIAPTLLRSIPQFIIATFVMQGTLSMQWPPLGTVAAWLLAVLGALLLSCAITMFMQSTVFWTVSGDGVVRIFPHLVMLFSGMNIPLPLMPDWMQTFLKYQPFATLSGTPALIFCGALPPGAVWETLGLQLLWSAAFVLIGRALLHKGLTRMTVAGG